VLLTGNGPEKGSGFSTRDQMAFDQSNCDQANCDQIAYDQVT